MGSLWRYRQWIWQAALSDFTFRYAGSGLGALWNVLTPLAMLAVYTIIFSALASGRLGGSTGPSYPLYLSAGFLPWAAFSDCLIRSTGAFVTSAPYLKKMAIPEQVFVAQTATSAGFGMLIAVVLLMGLALILHQPPQWTWLLLPVVAVLWQVFGFGLGLILSTFNVFYRDVGQLLAVALQIWMWSVPVVYPEDILPQAYRSTLPLNPVYPFITSLRDVFLFGQLPSVSEWSALFGWTLAAVALGYTVVRQFRSEVRDAL